MDLVIDGLVKTSALLAQAPNGDELLFVRADTDDNATRAAVSGFNGMEQVDIHLGTTAGPRDFWARFCGTQPGGRDQHVATINLTQNGISAADVSAQGVAIAIQTNAARIWAQSFGHNTPVYGIGAVDDCGIAWTGNLRATRVHKYTITEETLPNNEISFSQTELGMPGNLTFKLELFVPGLTTQSALTLEEKNALLADMKLQVETDFVIGGHTPLTYAGQAGFEGNNFVVAWSLNNPNNYYNGADGSWHHPAPGAYPMRITAGGRTLAKFTLNYT